MSFTETRVLDRVREAFRTTEEVVIENTVEVAQTSVPNTGAIKIELPENASSVTIKHITGSQTVSIGSNASITSLGTGTYPLEPSIPITIRLKKGNANELYGIASAGTIVVYALATIKE